MIADLVAGLVARGRSLWRAVRRGSGLEAEMDEEFRHHLALRAADLERAGLAPAEAARQARVEFGSPARYKDAGRDARGLRRVDALRVSWLDVRLGFRMLRKYPGLTVVGGLAMAFAIWVSAGAFEFVTQLVDPRLPFPAGERVVGLQSWDAAEGRVQRHVLRDFVTWRATLRSVEELGAVHTAERNLITADGDARPVEVAEISAAAFRLTRVRPQLGRTLVAADERPEAPLVAVIGHDVWQARFGGDPNVVGRTVRLGDGAATVVGVMPAGYAFPVSQSLWVPLRLAALEHAAGDGPALQLFGRLAPGVGLAEAQAELTTVGRRMAAEAPSTHRHRRPRVMPYARSVLDLSGTEALLIRSTNVFLVMLLVLICGNVALLMFARAATREEEIVVRTALGASRGRIVTQLFAEALVLGGVAATAGLAAAGFGLEWLLGVVEAEAGRRLPFWFHAELSPWTVAYAGALTLLGAVIAGVVPGLKVTRGLQTRLRQAGVGGSGLRFGGVWTAVIVAQVAVTVAFPVTSYLTLRDRRQIEAIEADFPAAEFLSARVDVDASAATADEAPTPAGPDAAAAVAATRSARVRTRYDELARRLMADPNVAGVAFAERLPRMYHPYRLVEVDGGGAAPLNPDYPDGYRVSSAAVGTNFFDVLGTPVRAGRGFHPGDLAPGTNVVIVNESFVRLVLGGRNPIGRHVRYRSFEESPHAAGDEPPGPWHEIVGVVRDLGMSTAHDPKVAGIYHPLVPGAASRLRVAVHVRGDPRTFEPRLRALAAAVDPTMRVGELAAMDALSDAELKFVDFWFRLTLLVSGIAIVLSLTGIYAVLSFTIARRTREIGIRVALGSDRRRVVAAILARPLRQVGAGVLAGGVLVSGLADSTQGGAVTPRGAALLVGYVALMTAVCLLACVVPAGRALGVEPTEALRGDV